MLKLLARLAWMLCLIGFWNATTEAAGPKATPHPRLGINLSGPVDWSSELPFVDVFRLSRTWVGNQKGLPWGKGPAPVLDASGWVTSLQTDAWAESPICTIEGGHYPSGTYTVLYHGKGTVILTGAAKVISTSPGRVLASVDSKKGGMFVRVLATDPQDPVRDIRVITPGHESTYATNPWNPNLISRWQGVACVRFMDMMMTNDSDVVSWNDRPKLTDATFSKRGGVAPELLIDLANRLKADAWFCIPHLADDGYVHKLAKMIKQKLDPSLKAYIEYSNEVWNSQFQQHKDAGAKGQAMGLATKPWEAAWKYTGYRSSQIFQIFEKEFGSTTRLVRVIPSQIVNPYISEQILTSNNAAKHADVLAVAPYLGLSVSPNTKPTSDQVTTWTVDRLLDHVEKVVLPDAISAVKAQKIVADRYGLKLVSYESGQHLVGVLGAENNKVLTALFQQANAHPRMGKIYEKYYSEWAAAGGDLICHFSSVKEWSKWGSWGLLQYDDDNPTLSPKFMATMKWAKAQGQNVNVP
jgi:hypothetical protein